MGFRLDREGKKLEGRIDGLKDLRQLKSGGFEKGVGGKILKCLFYFFIIILSGRFCVEYMDVNYLNEVWGLFVDFKDNWIEYVMKFNFV